MEAPCVRSITLSACAHTHTLDTKAREIGRDGRSERDTLEESSAFCRDVLGTMGFAMP